MEHGTDGGSTIHAMNLNICKHRSEEKEIAKELSLSIVCLTPSHAACIFGLSALQGDHENPQDIRRKEKTFGEKEGHWRGTKLIVVFMFFAMSSSSSSSLWSSSSLPRKNSTLKHFNTVRARPATRAVTLGSFFLGILNIQDMLFSLAALCTT